MRDQENVKTTAERFGMKRQRSTANALLPVVLLSAALAWHVPSTCAQQEDGGSQAPPKIVVDDMAYDFGEVWSGRKIEHTWTVHNKGGSVLRIPKIKPSCGCTVMRSYDREILPGESGKLPVTIDTTRLNSKVLKRVTVHSNDPENPETTLTIGGTVNQRIGIEPRRAASFGRIKPNEIVKRTLLLTNNTDKPVDLSLVSERTGVFHLELEETRPGENWELKVRTAPPYQERYNRGEIRLKTDIADQPVVEIPASVYALPKVEVAPSTVIIPKAMPRARKQPIRVTFNTDEPYKVLSASMDNADINVIVHETRPNAYTITLDLPPNYLPPAEGGELVVKTNYPEQETLKIDVAQRRTEATRRPPVQRLVGESVPPAAFEAPDGDKISTRGSDEVSLYMFYASWCGFCKKALPVLSQMYGEFSDKKVRFIGVNQDSLIEFGADPKNRRSRTKEQVEQQWQDMGISFPLVFDPAQSGRTQFLVTGLPTLFLVDAEGEVQRVYSGVTDVNNGILKRDVAALVGGKALPEQPKTITQTANRRKRPAQELVGKPIPDVTFNTPSGDSMSTGNIEHPTLYMFYASWCGFCKKALPQLADLHKQYHEKGIRIFGVNQDTLVEHGADPSDRRARTKEQVLAQWEDLDIPFPLVFDPESAGRTQFKVTGFPTMVLVGKGGKVERVYPGIGTLRDGTLKKEIALLAAGKSLEPQEFAAQTTPQRRKRPAQELEGKPAPKATFLTATEGSYNPAEPDHVSFTMFYASWCGHCKKALPKIGEMTRKFKEDPVRFAAVSLDQIVEFGADPDSRRSKTKEYVINQFKNLGLDFTQAFDPENAGKTKFKVTSFPTMFLVDQAGKIDKVYIGRGAVEDGSLERDIKALLGDSDEQQAAAPGARPATVAASSAQ